jgi:sugar transferase (PEP-CTERM/EpsH1 system associated)
MFVVPYAPNLVRVRPFNFIRYLSRRGHKVTVLALWTTEQERVDLEQLRAECFAVRPVHLPRYQSFLNSVGALLRPEPLQAWYCWQPELISQAILSQIQPDVIHVEHLRGALFGLRLKEQVRRLGKPVPVVWDSVDCISLLFRKAAAGSQRLVSKLITRFELGRTERYEGWLVNQFDRTLVTAPADREALNQLAPKNTTPDLRVIPNGVDLDYFKHDLNAQRETATLVMSGKMSYHANVTMVVNFVRESWPFIRAARPDAKLWIVGKDPSAEVQALSQDSAITVTGTVADVRPYLQRATIALAPVAYGVGIQNKVLEAMACGAPVVSTTQAVSALAIQPGVEVSVADTPTTFANEVVSLLNQPERRHKQSELGRHYVQTQHDWGKVVERLEDAYNVHPIYFG